MHTLEMNAREAARLIVTLEDLAKGLRLLGAEDRAEELEDVATWLRDEAPVEGLAWSPQMVRAVPPSVAARRVRLMTHLAGVSRRAGDGEQAIGFEDLSLWFADRAPLCREACQREGQGAAVTV